MYCLDIYMIKNKEKQLFKERPFCGFDAQNAAPVGGREASGLPCGFCCSCLFFLFFVLVIASSGAN